MTGDWGGARIALEERGIKFTTTWTHDASANVRGGIRRGTAVRGLVMGQLSIDLAALAHVPGATAMVSYAHFRGTNGSDVVGDIQAFSNIDAEPFSHVFEAWVEQVVADGALRAKVGRVDANTEFAVVGPAGDFINSSAGFSPSILGLPTYPDPAMSANLFVAPASWLAVSGGIYAGTLAPIAASATTVRDRFTIGQVTAAWNHAGTLGAGKLGAGIWHHRGMAARFDGGFSKGVDGWWATFEQRISAADATGDAPARGVQVFAKYGAAPAMLSVVHQHVMVGLVLDGGLRAGSQDGLGVAMTCADLSDVAAAGTPLDETSVEMFYKVKVLGFMTLRPNVQYVVHPSGDSLRANALVATLRTGIVF